MSGARPDRFKCTGKRYNVGTSKNRGAEFWGYGVQDPQERHIRVVHGSGTGGLVTLIEVRSGA
jgi:hypothetical protein